MRQESVPYSVYPNPASDKVTLRYQVDKPSYTSVVIKDFSGRVVDVLEENEFKEPGIHHREHSVSKFASGMYYYSIRTITGEKIARLVVVK